MNCKECHFLAKEMTPTSQNVGMRSFSFSLTQEERAGIDSEIPSTVLQNWNLKCHMGVWDAGLGNAESAKAQACRKRGADACFFFPYHKDMLFPAAIELQKRSQEAAEVKRSNLYTRIGLHIAAGALAISALVEYFKS